MVLVTIHQVNFEHHSRFLVAFDAIINNTKSLYILEFDGADYENWSIKMKTLMMEKGIWDTVEYGYAKLIDWIILIVVD